MTAVIEEAECILQDALEKINLQIKELETTRAKILSQIDDAKTMKRRALIQAQRERRQKLTTTQKKIYEHAYANPGCTKEELMALFPHGTPRGLNMMLIQLQRSGYIVNLGSLAFPRWFIA